MDIVNSKGKTGVKRTGRKERIKSLKQEDKTNNDIAEENKDEGE